MKNLVNNIIAANQRIKAVDGGVRETPLDESGIFSDQTGVSFLLSNLDMFALMAGIAGRLTSIDDAGEAKEQRTYQNSPELKQARDLLEEFALKNADPSSKECGPARSASRRCYSGSLG